MSEHTSANQLFLEVRRSKTIFLRTYRLNSLKMEVAALDLGTTSVKTGLLRPAETWGAGFALEGHDAAYVMV